MASRFTVVVAGASEEELADVQWCLSDWDCVGVPLNDEQTGVSSIPPTAKLMIVYARSRKTRWPFASNSAAPPGIPRYRFC